VCGTHASKIVVKSNVTWKHQVAWRMMIDLQLLELECVSHVFFDCAQMNDFFPPQEQGACRSQHAVERFNSSAEKAAEAQGGISKVKAQSTCDQHFCFFDLSTAHLLLHPACDTQTHARMNA
jgi:hypothetical protein